VIVIPVVVVVADELLVIALPAEVIVHAPMIREVQIGPGFVDDYLVAVIKIITLVPGRQVVGKDPAPAVLVDELVVRNIIITLDIGDIVIIHVIVAGRAPGGLNTDVDGDLNLCLNGSGKGEADQGGACQEVLFHEFEFKSLISNK
jgi:hypothetical protein